MILHIGQLLSNHCSAEHMDEDIERLSREDLVTEVKKLRAGIRAHRDSTKHELCWHHPQLWSLLPEKLEPEVASLASVSARLPQVSRVTRFAVAACAAGHG